jgi:hypothetical protein
VFTAVGIFLYLCCPSTVYGVVQSNRLEHDATRSARSTKCVFRCVPHDAPYCVIALKCSTAVLYSRDF